jgi:hypothetical protein
MYFREDIENGNGLIITDRGFVALLINVTMTALFNAARNICVQNLRQKTHLIIERSTSD